MKNKKLILATSGILFSSLLSAGCMMMGGGMSGGSHNGSSTDMKEMDMSGDSKSYIIAKRYCSQCHEMKKKDIHSSTDWKPIIGRMMGYLQNKAKLKPDAYEKVMIENYYGIN